MEVVEATWVFAVLQPVGCELDEVFRVSLEERVDWENEVDISVALAHRVRPEDALRCTISSMRSMMASRTTSAMSRNSMPFVNHMMGCRLRI